MVQPVLITPFQTGLFTSISPTLAPFDSFEELNNFHIEQGFLEKRAGYRKFGYMVHNPVATITAVSQANPAVVTAANTFSNGDQILITNVTGMTELNGNIYTVANRTAADFELSGVDSTAYGAYSAGGRAATFAGNRIMGISQYIKADNTKITLAFDTVRAAVYNGTNDRFDPLDSANIMSGSATDYIWAENWQPTTTTHVDNRLYFTNGKAYSGGLDGIRYYDFVASSTTTTAFTPSLGGTRVLYGGKLIFAIKSRLVVLNVFEYDGANTDNFPQRARWCKAQNPGNWDDTIAGGGGYVDAPTGEHIISARALQDVIIVFFTNSVWSLRPVPNPALPFRWDKINSFRACDGRMATVGFDRYVAALGIRGITATDGVMTQRIDTNIEKFTIDEINVDAFSKVFCQRDYANKRWWSLFPGGTNAENNRALISDDDSKSFSTYDIDLNCLGYGLFSEDYGLNDFIAANDLDISIYQAEGTLQDYFYQENQENFLGGSTDGIVYVLGTDVDDDGTEIEASLYTNAWTPTLKEGTESQLCYVDIYVVANSQTQMTVEFYKDSDTDSYTQHITDILPPLGYISSIANISQANPAVVTAPSHGLSTGDIIYIYGVQGMVEISDQYTITIVDENNFSLDGIDSTSFTAYTTGGQVLRKEFYRTKVWKRVIAGGIGFQHRMKISSTGNFSPLRIEAFKPYFKSRGRRSIN